MKQSLQRRRNQACGERKQKSGKRSWERKASPWGLDSERERSSSRPQSNLSLAYQRERKQTTATNLRMDWVEGYFFPSL